MGERERAFLQRSEAATPIELAQDMPSPTLTLPTAPRAVLVELHNDQRLSLGALQRRSVTLAESYVITKLAPGNATLVPADSATSTLAPLVLDKRSRLRLEDGVLFRLDIRIGDQVFIAARDDREISVFNVALIDWAATSYAADIERHSARLSSAPAS